jgi:hypothetical protein
VTTGTTTESVIKEIARIRPRVAIRVLFRIAVCTALTGAHAQTVDLAQSEVNRAIALLESSDWKSKTWGAFYAGRLRNPALQDKLIAQLRLVGASQRPIVGGNPQANTCSSPLSLTHS